MLSNKLTFSLVLVVMLALIAGPALAQQVTSTQIATAATPGVNYATAMAPFVVVAKGTDAATAQTNTGIVAGVPLVPVAAVGTPPAGGGAAIGFPDLEELLTLGGTIELVVEIAEAGSTRAIGADGAVGGTDDLNAAYVYSDGLSAAELNQWVDRTLRGNLVITEIMWGLDRGVATPATEDGAQWIEIFHNGAAALDAVPANQGVFLVTTSNRRQERLVIMDNAAAGASGDIDGADAGRVYAVVDRVSTIDFRGAHWAPKGQSGVSAPGRPAPNDVPSPLISMYRKAELTAGGDYNHTDRFRDIAAGAAENRTGDATDPAAWVATPENGRLNVSGRYFVGTPGHPHLRTGDVVPHARAAVGAADDGGKGIIINEFRNDTTAANEDWIELINNEPAGTDPIGVSGWTLQLITADANGDGRPELDIIATLPNYRLAPGAYLLIVNQDPNNSSLAAGRNINEEAAGVVINSGAEHVYYISDFTLPNDDANSGRYLLVLRRGGQTNANENFEDFAGNGFFSFDAEGTEIYPLRGWQLPPENANIDPMFRSGAMLAGNVSYGRGYDPVGAARNVAHSGGERLHQDSWHSYGPQGGIGYDADPAGIAAGTPGYANWVPNSVMDDRRDDNANNNRNFDGTVIFSEIMYDAGDDDNLAQWIELYNSSTTQGINIGGWTLGIHNRNAHTGDDQYIDDVLELDSVTIPPNRTLLLVSRPVNNRSRTLDQDDPRIYDLYTRHRVELGLNLLNSRLLSPHGFYLELKAPSEMSQGLDLVNPAPDYVMDMVGNLERDARTGDVVMGDDDRPIAEWELSDIENYQARMAGDPRQSIVRKAGGIYGGEGYAFTGAKSADPGEMIESWRGSSGHRHSPERIYYGHPDDISTPAFRTGGVLPVSLSSFRPVRDAATGAVVIRWITESELNNAGFNILRSETKNGEFTVVNLKGIIPGHGTTSEKHVYEWTDTTAKPNVVYYYQIEDVSFDGQRTTLRTTHLRGNVNAAGKVTTTWGDLKTQ